MPSFSDALHGDNRLHLTRAGERHSRDVGTQESHGCHERHRLECDQPGIRYIYVVVTKMHGILIAIRTIPEAELYLAWLLPQFAWSRDFRTPRRVCKLHKAALLVSPFTMLRLELTVFNSRCVSCRMEESWRLISMVACQSDRESKLLQIKNEQRQATSYKSMPCCIGLKVHHNFSHFEEVTLVWLRLEPPSKTGNRRPLAPSHAIAERSRHGYVRIRGYFKASNMAP